VQGISCPLHYSRNALSECRANSSAVFERSFDFSSCQPSCQSYRRCRVALAPKAHQFLMQTDIDGHTPRLVSRTQSWRSCPSRFTQHAVIMEMSIPELACAGILGTTGRYRQHDPAPFGFQRRNLGAPQCTSRASSPLYSGRLASVAVVQQCVWVSESPIRLPLKAALQRTCCVR
jgi:hypothetical protein